MAQPIMAVGRRTCILGSVKVAGTSQLGRCSGINYAPYRCASAIKHRGGRSHTKKLNQVRQELRPKKEEDYAPRLEHIMNLRGGRMDSLDANDGVVMLSPLELNVILPEKRIFPSNFTFWSRMTTHFHDFQLGTYETWKHKRNLTKIWGPQWEGELGRQAVGIYSALQKAMAIGDDRPVFSHARRHLIEDLNIWSKTRKDFLDTHRVDWRLHSYDTPKINTIRVDETANPVQVIVAVRLKTVQSVEVKNMKGKRTSGDHSKPKTLDQIWVFSRTMKLHDPWKIDRLTQPTKPHVEHNLPTPKWVTGAAGVAGLSTLYFIWGLF